jgi:hypothetical protein
VIGAESPVEFHLAMATIAAEACLALAIHFEDIASVKIPVKKTSDPLHFPSTNPPLQKCHQYLPAIATQVQMKRDRPEPKCFCDFCRASFLRHSMVMIALDGAEVQVSCPLHRCYFSLQVKAKSMTPVKSQSHLF